MLTRSAPQSDAGAEAESLFRTGSGSTLDAMQSPREPVLALPAPPFKGARQHREAAAQTTPPGHAALSSEASTSQVSMQLVFAHNTSGILEPHLQVSCCAESYTQTVPTTQSARSH